VLGEVADRFQLRSSPIPAGDLDHE
jgi:hypothetical protein